MVRGDEASGVIGEGLLAHLTAEGVTDSSQTPRWRRWTDPRSLRASLGFRAVLRAVGRYAIVMGVVYAVTLSIAMAVAQAVTA
ncbi:hypothetical protein [Mycobacterium hubeiense]|uniref:hypothetical protein n=1 Tax=Mycobacterium hubeiense TaxID=1867256 RepID=UPI000C7F77B5|nr:hypothetical protein [Mycobacterium sp. QGD 101]